MRAPRLAVVTTAHPWGDPRVFERELAACLDWGVETHAFLVLEGPPPPRAWSGDPRLTLHPWPPRRSRLGRFMAASFAWWRVWRAGPFEAVHFHDPELVPAMALLALLWPEAYVLYDVHEDLPLQVASKAYLPSWARGPVARLCRWMHRGVRGVFSGYAPATEAIARSFPAASTRVVHNYPKALFSRVEAPLDPLRALYIGALSRDRGLLAVLEAVALARAEAPGLRLDLVGRLEDPRVAEAVAGAVREGWCVHVPWLPPEALARHAAGAGIGLVTLLPRPGYLESLPTKLFEYMAMGIPVLASDFPLWRRLVADSGAGRVVAPEPRAIARALAALAGDPEALARHAAAGREAYRTRYRWEAERAHLRWHLERAGLLPALAPPNASRSIPCAS